MKIIQSSNMGQRGSSLNDDSDSQPSSLSTIKINSEDEMKTRQESELPIINPLNVSEREKYHYFGRNNSIRKKFHYCGDCPYRACHWKPLKSHIKKLHPSSTTAIPLSSIKALKKPKGKSGQLHNKSNIIKTLNDRYRIAKLSCSQCDYRTDIPHRMKRHQVLCHQKRSDLEYSLSPIKKCENSSINEVHINIITVYYPIFKLIYFSLYLESASTID